MPTSGSARQLGRDPAGQRRHRLVDVDHVVAAGAQLAAASRPRRGRDRHIRHRAVGLEADRAAQRDQVVGGRQRLRPRAAMQDRCDPIVDGSYGASTRTSCPSAMKLLGEGLDVPRHAARIGPRIRRNQRDPHDRLYGSRVPDRRSGFLGPVDGVGLLAARMHPWISMPVRHFVKYTFLKVDPAWRRLDDERRARRTSGSSSPPARTSPKVICCAPSRWSAPAATRT